MAKTIKQMADEYMSDFQRGPRGSYIQGAKDVLQEIESVLSESSDYNPKDRELILSRIKELKGEKYGTH